MDRIEKLESDVQNYLCSRRIFRTVEVVVSLIFVVVLVALDNSILSIIACVACAILVPECFLAIRRNDVKIAIKNEKLIAEKEMEFYSFIKTQCEKFRNEFILKGSEKFVSDECKELVWKEEMGIGWLSTKIKEYEAKCNEAEETIKDLALIKRLVVF